MMDTWSLIELATRKPIPPDPRWFVSEKVLVRLRPNQVNPGISGASSPRSHVSHINIIWIGRPLAARLRKSFRNWWSLCKSSPLAPVAMPRRFQAATVAVAALRLGAGARAPVRSAAVAATVAGLGAGPARVLVGVGVRVVLLLVVLLSARFVQ